LNGLALLAACVLVARSLGPAAGTRALLLSPLVMGAIPTVSFLEKGNVQGAMIAMAMIAMVAFERRRWALGGALLAYATVSKLFPGMLILYLLVQRRWRALAWTAAFGAILTLLPLAVLGTRGYAAFLEHLPGLVGGEAFPAFRNPASMAVNYSVPGLVFKLKLFGVPGMGFGASKVVGWLFTIVVVAVTFLLGKRSVADEDKPVVWLAVLTLATLRSPFLPHAYAGFSPAVDGNLARSASAADHANPRAARRRLRRAQLLLAHRLADGSQVPRDAHAGTASGHDRDRLLRGVAIHQTFERNGRNHRRIRFVTTVP
jgi:hypothetical protein